MSKVSAGILLYRRVPHLEVLIVHPGGPFWAKKDLGAWSIPKGLLEPGEDALTAAVREFQEETSWSVAGPFLDLGEVRQKSGKLVRAFGAAGDADPATLVSNRIEIDWPPRSGRKMTIPEVDRAAWLVPDQARAKLNPAQAPFLDRLQATLGSFGDEPT
ncbi:MAG: NUDIX domain-containing protein [Myxococcota bacterium]